ncbi:hypothetical protein F4813DRAFT_364019 [Daldinia decipiens]|uniref:uncharacterized protein n=1 Tax=Daldinia decipiens TaxID=326647 RepID=UPI0020C45100|nr:uncharacterized protein F4813DRAFT_364019 [Daldinia decipiens]KAI1656337.1 hypothetical protein F4813DRAFT_364019 [Daldinia decipiens]
MNKSVINRLFSGKKEKIGNQFVDFLRKPGALKDTEAYLNQTKDHKYGNYEKWVKEKTVFTGYADSPALLAESKNVLIIGNHNSFDVTQYGEDPGKAGMSMIHILGIPKKNIFNGVSLDHDTVSVIDETIDLFKDKWETPGFRQKVLDYQKLAIANRTSAEPFARLDGGLEFLAAANDFWEAMNHWKELEAGIHTLTFDDFTFGLHLWPDHSVGHLHLHIIATPDWCRKYSTLKHDEKTKDALEVRDFVRGLSPI